MDILTDVLNVLQLKSALCTRTEISAPWRFSFSSSRDSIFHIFNAGNGYICIEGEANPIPIAEGDVVVLPHGHAHAICDTPTSPLTQSIQIDYSYIQDGYQHFSFDGNEPRTVLLCGVFHLERPNHYPLLEFLPKIIHIQGEQGRMLDDLVDTLRLIGRESHATRPGTEAMQERLTELLFLQVIRAWIESQPEATGGWIYALRDTQIGKALGLIHQHPERLWRVKDLADAVAMSRSAFSARFALLVGETPMKYLTNWRMRTAARLMRNGIQIEEIAQQVGYESEAAFRKAFKRELGMAPGRYRRAE